MKKVTAGYIAYILSLLIISSFLYQFSKEAKQEIVSANSRKRPLETFSGLNPEFKHLILLSQPRTGSTVIGKMLAYSDDIFYSLEPLNIGIRSSAVELNNTSSYVKFLKKILQCNFNDFEDYRRIRDKRLWHLTTTLVRDLCYSGYIEKNNLCELNEVNVDEVICRISKIHFIKTIYLPLQTAFQLMEDSELDVGVLYLVRDPRGTMASRETSIDNNFILADALRQPKYLCSRIREDISILRHLNARFPDRVLIVRYEDFASEPVEETRKMYSFMGVPFTISSEAMLASQTLNKEDRRPSDPFSTFRDSKSRATNWKSNLPERNITEIQNECRDILYYFGYKLHS